MNNVLSDSFIDKLNTTALGEVKTMFSEAIKDTTFQERRNQRLGVNNRLQLKSSTNYVFGRGANGIPVYMRPDSKNNNDANVRLNLKCHKDYPNIITSNKSGYLSGFSVTSDIENDPTVDYINTFLKQNNFNSIFNELVQKTSGYGVKAVTLSKNINTGDLQLSYLEPWNYAPFYNESGILVAVMQWQEITESLRQLYNSNQYKIRVTTIKEELFFLSTGEFSLSYNAIDYPALVTTSGTEFLDGRRPHLYQGVPVVEFKNNGDALGDVEKTLDTQDIIDEIKSKASTEMSAFASVTLVDKTTDGEAVNVTDMFSTMGDFGVLTGQWEWLEKQFQAYPQIQAHYTQLEHDVYESSNSYDPNSLSGDGSAPTAFQIKQKMKGLMNATIDTESQFRGALLELFRLVLTYGRNNNEAWRNLDIVFEHTIPEDKVQTLKLLKEAGFIPSQNLLASSAGIDQTENEKNLITDRENIMNALTNEPSLDPDMDRSLES